MSYRREVQQDEHIPLPIETVYNSTVDALVSKDENGDDIYFQNGIQHFNRIYFDYPPEWKTSNVGEKIIGIRRMNIHRKTDTIKFNLYIRKYLWEPFNDKAIELFGDKYEIFDDKIQQVIDTMDETDVKVFKIECHMHLTNDINDFADQVIEFANDNTLYRYLYREIGGSNKSDEEKIAAYEALDRDRNNYDLMCLRNDIPFWLEISHWNCKNKQNIIINPNDKHVIGEDFMIEIAVNDEGGQFIKFKSLRNDGEVYNVDFLITRADEPFEKSTNDNNNEEEEEEESVEDDYDDYTYKKLYKWDDDNDLPLPFSRENPGRLTEKDRFDSDTADFFNIGTSNPYRNRLDYVTKFHRELVLKHITTDLQCEVAASFANQSNRNIIGRTNETFIPIKYYKVNDNDDKFWIELYNKDFVDIPVSFNDEIVFTMDMVFLQNRKLLYS
ncbi:hypothetical protein M9Y10_023738 [Tritrichomonas musculus]|uniref:Uncharacterized protein n=1 Tax=Tritrichomonas musculus TaxID=1915356 RepID=A0ABR2KXU6_9EUKA